MNNYYFCSMHLLAERTRDGPNLSRDVLQKWSAAQTAWFEHAGNRLTGVSSWGSRIQFCNAQQWSPLLICVSSSAHLFEPFSHLNHQQQGGSDHLHMYWTPIKFSCHVLSRGVLSMGQVWDCRHKQLIQDGAPQIRLSKKHCSKQSCITKKN